MATTTNYAWETPDDTDLVKDGAAAIRTLGSSIDSTVFTNASASIAKTIIDAKGDLISATAADTPARLAVGTNGQVLVADSTASTGLAWATPTSGGMTLIASGSLSTNSVVITSLSQAYKDLKIFVKGYQGSEDFNLEFRLNEDSGSNYSYNAISNNSTTVFNSTYQAQTQVSIEANEAVGAGYFMNLDIFDYTNSTTRKAFSLVRQGLHIDSSFRANIFAQGQYHPGTAAAITAITLKLDAAKTFAAGTYEIYGVK